MIEPGLIEAFQDCLVRLEHGSTLAECLRAYPAEAGRLRPLLETALLIGRALPHSLEVVTAQDRVRGRIALAAQFAAPARPGAGRRWLGLVATLILMFISITGGGYLAAENSLPGDTLYPFKRLTEDVRLRLTGSDVLAEAFRERRVEEVRRVVALGRPVEVEFQGQIEAIDGVQWQVAGIAVEVASAALPAGPVGVSDRVNVRGKTGPDGVQAERIDLMERNALPQPDPGPTPTVVPTIVTTVTATPMPTATQTPTSTSTPVPTLTATLTPTLTSTATQRPIQPTSALPTVNSVAPTGAPVSQPANNPNPPASSGDQDDGESDDDVDNSGDGDGGGNSGPGGGDDSGGGNSGPGGGDDSSGDSGSGGGDDSSGGDD